MDTSKFFIIGANGQLGRALQFQYPNAQIADVDQLDITDLSSIKKFDWSKVEVILNAAAYTNVDGAETDEGRVAAWKINAQAVSYLCDVAATNQIKLIHISTDYVFDGSKNPHTENESFSPLSVYGSSKAAGDIVVSLVPNYYILRTSWVIGDGKNFVRTMLELGKKGIDPQVVSDQVGRPTFTTEIVRAIDHLLQKNSPSGTYNITNDGEPVSWADLTRAIFQVAGYPNKVTDISTEKYYEGKAGIAARPLNSVMELQKIKSTGLTITNWQNDLKYYIERNKSV